MNFHTRLTHELTELDRKECARAIASWYYAGPEGYVFVSTGAIHDPTRLWRDLAGDVYQSETANNRLALDMLGTYLVNAGKRGPQQGWSDRWVR